MRHAIAALAILPLFAAAPAQAGMATVTPEQVGEIFCISRTGNDDALLTGLLSDELRTLIAYADARNASLARAFPDEKPPLGDGIPWASYPDYAARCTVSVVAVESGTATLAIGYGFPEAPGADYTDTLVLEQQMHQVNPDIGVWRIGDVRYSTGGTLRDVLTTAFDNP